MADRRDKDPRRKSGVEDCNQCGGTGTEMVQHGDTFFTGDDDCPHCKGGGKVRRGSNPDPDAYHG